MRVGLGVAAGVIALLGIFWFTTDFLNLLGASSRDVSVLTKLLMVIFGIVAALQVGSLVARGQWLRGRHLSERVVMGRACWIVRAFCSLRSS